MNRVIARLFSGILGLMHVLVLCLAAWSFFVDPLWRGGPAWAADPAARGVVILAGLAVYVLVAGLLSTVVAINDNLEELNRTLARSERKGEADRRVTEKRAPEKDEPELRKPARREPALLRAHRS